MTALLSGNPVSRSVPIALFLSAAAPFSAGAPFQCSTAFSVQQRLECDQGAADQGYDGALQECAGHGGAGEPGRPVAVEPDQGEAAPLRDREGGAEFEPAQRREHEEDDREADAER